MIPQSVNIGSIWKILPPGIHEATLREIEERFATNAKRRTLYEGFTRGAHTLWNAGCTLIFLDGSFVSDKEEPGDFDACWDPTGVDPGRLDPVLLDFSDGRRRQKLKYGGEFFPSSARADGSMTFADFFQIDKDTGHAKGIVQVRIPGLPGEPQR